MLSLTFQGIQSTKKGIFKWEIFNRLTTNLNPFCKGGAMKEY